jgi:xanthine dehydrogenase molybdenum-binding subunit
MLTMPLRAVGRSIPKRDAFEKVCGAARYTGDLSLPGMLYARFLRSPYAHARIVRIDTTAALELRGVRAVMTHENSPTTRYSDTTSDQLSLLPGEPILDQRLFDSTVRYVGEPVAAVAADDLETVLEALELIDVEYEPLPAVFDAQEALASDAPRMHENAAGNIAARLAFSRGDVEAGLEAADCLIEQTFTTSRQKHVQMEPTACLAHWAVGDRVSVWSPTQTPHLVKQKLASLFELPQSSVRVVNPHIGGAFGNTLGFTLEPHAVALSRAVRRPVKLDETREEMFVAHSSRHPMVITLAAGFRRDGQLLALRARLLANTGAYATEGPDVVGACSSQLFRLYPCANRSFEGLTVYTNAPVAGGFRGYGGPQAAFAMEQVMDMAAERLGLDPLELRLRISAHKGGVDGSFGRPILSCGLPECFALGSDAVSWEPVRASSQRTGRRRRGVGMASVMWVSGTACLPSTLDSSAATLTVHQDASMTVQCAACDMGTGARTTLAQVAADELGVPVEQVRLGAVDTDMTPFETGAHASRTLFAAGNATRIAAADARAQILSFAATRLEVAAQDLRIDRGVIRVEGVPEKTVGLSTIVNAAYRKGHHFLGRGESQQVNEPPFGAQFVEVEVDTDTGVVRVLRVVAAHDVGRAINPKIVEGQIEGAIAQGLGFAMIEDLPLDPETGAARTLTLADYRIPTVEWMPEITVILVEDPAPGGPFGAKGCGEMGLGPTAAAIANAIYNATGVRLTELPMTPERVLAALRTRQAAV